MAASETAKAIAQAQIADDAWTHELETVFGSDACNARYQPRGRGEPGTLLAALHAFYRDASRAMENAMAARRKAEASA